MATRTSLISPGNYGTLEFEAFTLPDGRVPNPPPPGEKDTRKLTQFVTFTRDVVDYGKHQTMQLHSRNNKAIWEPKVVSGLGYTIKAQDSSAKYPDVSRAPGMPRLLSIGLTDVVKPDIKTGNEFYSRVGVCYTNADGTYPPGDFEIKRGYRSWGGNGVDPNDADLRKLFIYLNLAYPDTPDPVNEGQKCFNLASQTPSILNDVLDGKVTGCPATGIYSQGGGRGCAFGGTPDKSRNGLPVCSFQPTTLKKANSLAELTKPTTGKPVAFDKWFYDQSTGMRFFYVVQDRPNAKGTSPLGNCTGGATDPSCPDPNAATQPENYYTCPPEGCVSYNVRLAATTPYTPGASKCGGSADSTAIYTLKPEYTQPAPTGVNKLVFLVPPGSPAPPPPPSNLVQPTNLQTVENVDVVTAFPHRKAQAGGKDAHVICPVTAPPPSFNALTAR